jgi:hypothetical protein
MAVPAVVDASLVTSLSARPNNYGVTHVGVTSLPDNVIWQKAVLVRKYTGYPQNINDGTTVYTLNNDNYIVKVASIYGTSPVSSIMFTGGNTLSYDSSKDYIVFTGVPATGGTGNGVTFDVTRSGPKAGGTGSIISVVVNCGGEGYTSGDTLTIDGSKVGGVSTTHDVTISVKAVGTASAKGIKTITTPTTGITVSTTYTNVSGVATGSSIGTSSLFTVSTTGVTITSGGSNFAVGDYISIPSSSLGGTSSSYQPNEYGMKAKYHIYDTYGNDSATAINPNSAVSTKYTGNNLPTKAYYSLFVQYTLKSGTLIPTDYYWKKAGDISAVLIQDTGTLDLIQSHIPKFYITSSQNGTQNDLVDFLRVFAFQLDVYKTQAKNVFYMTKTNTTDETLLKMLLKQFGGSYTDVNDIAQARVLLNNLIYNFQTSGSLNGLKNVIESYTSFNPTITIGRNKLLDYNSSSFEETTGLWNPTTDQTTYPTISSVGPVNTQTVGTSSVTTAAFTDSAYSTGKGTILTSANCATTSTTVTVTDTTNLKAGTILSVSTGTGAFAAGTVVTSILSNTTFRINQAPTTALSNATLRASYNMVTGMGKVLSTTGSATFYLGPKKIKTTATAASGTNQVTVLSGNIPAVNDYIVETVFPYGTYVKSISTNTLTLSSTSSSSLASGTEIWFSSNATDKTDAASAWVAATANKPYTFSIYANAGGLTTTSTATASIAWYDKTGTLLSVSTGTSVTIASASSKVWTPVKTYAVAPPNTAFLEPRINITGITSGIGFYLDAAQLDVGQVVVSKQVTASGTNPTLKLTTVTDHNYVLSDAIGSTNYITVTGVGAPFDGGPYLIDSIPDTSSITYKVTTTSSTATTSSLPAINGMISSNSPFEDVRVTYIDVAADRINLICNPSFEVDTTYWGTVNSTKATASGGVSGSQSAQVTCSTTTTAIAGIYAGVNSTASTRFSITGGAPYIFSAYAKDVSTSAQVAAKIEWYDASNSIISTTSGTATTINTSGWTRVTVTDTAPAGASYATPTIYTKTAVSNGAQFLVEDVLFEYGSILNPYFDGSFDGMNYSANGINIDSMWERNGTAHACRSHYYINRVGNSGRLKSIITDGLYYA